MAKDKATQGEGLKQPPAPGAESTDNAPKVNPILAILGMAIYSVTAGAVTLYPDKKRAGVKNGRAGHCTFAVSPRASIQASIYMDVENVTVEGVAKVKKTYRLAFPKGVTVNLGTEQETAAFKQLHAQAWKDARTAKTATTDADSVDSSVVEYD